MAIMHAYRFSRIFGFQFRFKGCNVDTIQLISASAGSLNTSSSIHHQAEISFPSVFRHQRRVRIDTMDLPDSMIVVDTVVTSISLLCVLLRFYTRSVIVKRLWTEDILIGIVEVLAIGWLVTISFGMWSCFAVSIRWHKLIFRF